MVAMCFGFDAVFVLYLIEGKEGFLRIKGTVFNLSYLTL
jgi:hypothetical protein